MILEHEYYPHEFKLSAKKSVVVLPKPKRTVHFLQQHTGAPALPTVKTGDMVTKGQVIGDSSSYVFAPIHASICGKVKAITPWIHPVLGKEVEAIVIEANDNQEEITLEVLKEPFTPQIIRQRAREAGLVGMGGAAFPTHVKLNPTKPVKYVVINGAECEPYLTVDHQQMLEHPEKLIKGTELIMQAVGADTGLIAIEDNKMDAIRLLKKLTMKSSTIKVAVLPSKYPQGAEKVMIKTLLGKEVPRGGLPMDVGVVVSNITTAIYLEEAVFEGKILTEKVITISGHALKTPINARVYLGTVVKDLVEEGIIQHSEAAKLIVGGPMTGFSQASLEVPIIKGTSGLLFMKLEKQVNTIECIRCSRCIMNCPLRLMPAFIAKSTKVADHTQAEKYGALDCFECGRCSYVCPAGIPIVHHIKVAKSEIFNLKKAASKS